MTRSVYLLIGITLLLLSILLGFKQFQADVQDSASTEEMKYPIVDRFIGVNTFHDDPIELIKVAGCVREYHNWSWNDRPIYVKGKPKVSSFPENELVFNLWNGAWNFDKFYKELHENSIEIVPCLKGSLKSLNNNYGKPVPPNHDPTDPLNYAAHADYLFQYAARYGSNSNIENEKLKVRKDIDQDIVAGLNYIKYYENWNEPNAWWLGDHWNFSAEEFAAMCSADYDGHLGAMGDTFGVKNADPNAKLVMGGIISLDMDYIKDMVKWAEINRGGQLPFDVINLHHYAFKEPFGKSRIGVSPEEDDFKDKVMEFVNFRNQKYPELEVWVTEFGYDTHQSSPQKAPQIGDMSPYEVQAIWLVRSYLLLSSTGIEKAFMYMLRDAGKGKGKYSTSGLIGPKGDWEPKMSWYYLYTLKNALQEMRFSRALDVEDKNVIAYEYTHVQNNKKALVVWAKTSNQTKIENYPLIKTNANMTDIQGLRFIDKSSNGEFFKPKIESNTLFVTVEETPKIIYYHSNE